MDNTELKEVLLHPQPIAFGDTVYTNGIEAIIWRRLRQRALFGKELGIVQAEVLDSTGAVHLLNPQRLRLAEPGEVTTIASVPVMFEKRLMLLSAYRSWCEENELGETPETLMAFLYAEDLINIRKAYDVIRSCEENI